MKEKEFYKEKIAEMVEKIEDLKFLKRIYISLEQFLKEIGPSE